MITASVFLIGKVISIGKKGESEKAPVVVSVDCGKSQYLCLAWGNLGMVAKQELPVGSNVFVSGKQEIKDNVGLKVAEVSVGKFVFLGNSEIENRQGETVILCGNVGKVDSSYTPKGEMLTKFSLAVNIGYGETKRTNWYNCAVWGKQGEMAQKLLKVGSRLVVEGKQEIKEWTDKEGNKKQSIEVTVTDFNVFGGKKADETESSTSVSANVDDGDDVPY